MNFLNGLHSWPWYKTLIVSFIYCYAFVLAKNAIFFYEAFSGHPIYSPVSQLTVISIIDALYYGVITFVVLQIASVKKISLTALVLTFAAITAAMLAFQIESASRGGTIIQAGYQLLVDGNLTFYGYLDALSTPLTFLFIMFLCVLVWRKSH